MTPDAHASRYRQTPDRVVLPAEGTRRNGSDQPPVRIFLGTEDGQWRAERIFFYSIEQVRDPARTYEIYLMKNLAGFDRRGWRTGFTHYRFAVPEYAGFEGRAIYNDVDQIYLSDPSELFDLDMGGHGYLSVSAEDTSVMLLDCSRMGKWWTHPAAAGRTKNELLRGPAGASNEWGRLDGCWNARDTEYVEGHSKLLHFTALHLQPWRPFPEQYSYHHHPLQWLWLDLERRADAQGYQVFGPDRPSPRFMPSVDRAAAGGCSPAVPDSAGEFLDLVQPRSVLEVTLAAASKSRLPGAARVSVCRVNHLAEPTGRFDAAASGGLLEELPGEDIPWILENLFSRAAKAVYVAVRCCRSPNREANVDATRAVRPVNWWHRQIARAARRYPRLAWQLDARVDGQLRTVRADGLAARQPLVWILEGAWTGDNTQLRRLAEALGWPMLTKRMEYNRLHVLPNQVLSASLANLRSRSRTQLSAPWPDIVIASGKRNSGVARWIKRQSGNATRLVHLGRPWARLDAFDLIVTTPQYRLPARDNVHLNLLPLSRFSAVDQEKRRREISDDYADLPRPLITLLVGGDSWSYAFSPAAARRLGLYANRRVRGMGGSLLITTSPRTSRAAARALFSVIDVPGRLHVYSASRENPYVDFLAMADEVLVSGDSAAMISDAVATGRKVDIFPLDRRPLTWLITTARKSAGMFRPTTYRGTPRQQGPVRRLYDALVERGVVTPARDLEWLHDLVRQHVVDKAGPTGSPGGTASEELHLTVERVHHLFSEGRHISR